MDLASAPGKVMLFGEYAVLGGGLALVAAVARRARCRYTPGPGLVVAGRGHGTRHWPPEPGDAPLPFAEALFRGLTARPGHYTLDTDALLAEAGGAKLGLGSSAASTVALAAAATGSTDALYLYALAFAAHREAQGSGSGADVAAAAFGGVIRYRLCPDDPPNEIEGLGAGRPVLWTVWTGQPASTQRLVAAVDGGQAAAREAALAQIAAAAEAAAQAWPGDLVEPAGATIDALETLGAVRGVAIVTPVHRALDALARPLGGRVKPTGAGGGDLAWIVGQDADHEAHLATRLAAAGHAVLALPVDPVGAALAEEADTGAQEGGAGEVHS